MLFLILKKSTFIPSRFFFKDVRFIKADNDEGVIVRYEGTLPAEETLFEWLIKICKISLSKHNWCGKFV